MLEYDYHCLIDNKHLRTNLLFCLALKYKKCAKVIKEKYAA
jgi:hypothetical protein